VIVATALCPNCEAPFETHTIEALYGRVAEIDVCTGCQGIWFDDAESLQLSPWGTLTLFRIIHEHQSRGRRPLCARLECPRCKIRLTLAIDQQRTTRFQYHRCPRGHGRFITFFQFLRARNFIRSLTPREIADLRARVKQMHCSNCSAPIDLDKDIVCSYCRAPISMLDPDQVKSTLAELQAADARRQQIDPALPLTLMAERLKTERVFEKARRTGGRSLHQSGTTSGATSFAEVGLDVVLRWLSPNV
jgi:Zn-finger nucleic acid-binding protein